MRFYRFHLLSFALSAAKGSAQVSDDSLIPRVTIQDGTVIGTIAGLVESFKGIPFADPPLGPLRLKPPRPLSRPFGAFISTPIPSSCPQFLSQIDRKNLPSSALGILSNTPFLQIATEQSEDCLNLNVQRPALRNPLSKLPVVVFFFGGGFEFGSTQLYDASGLISTSIDFAKPIIYVAANYRVGGFGFLGGKEMKEDNSTNLGLRDQRLALQWVQDNIAAFGGDPAKVTIWGESAGAISVFDHTIINGGDNTYKGSPLFRAAIMDSGSVIPTLPVDNAKPQKVYNSVVSAAGCGFAKDTLQCLRAVPYTILLDAMNSVPGVLSYRSVDLAYLPRPDPSDNFFPISPDIAVANGAFTKVPVIIGDQEDEGTLFSLAQTNITFTVELVEYLKSFFPLATLNQISSLVATYPDNPAAGSPFNTGLLNVVYPQYKRVAAILGDITFTLTRRGYLAQISSQVPAWSYLGSYLSSTPILGSFHFGDILEVYFDLPSIGTSRSIQTHYISFINSMDPNSIPNLLRWPQYSTSSKLLLNFGELASSITVDNFRQTSYEYFNSITQFLKI